MWRSVLLQIIPSSAAGACRTESDGLASSRGAGELYAYLPNVPENDVLLSVPGTVKDNNFGWSIGRGAFAFVPGKWTVLAQRVKLNDFGAANGELELFVDGVSVICASGLVISQHVDTRLRGVQFQTFFGGA